ncbi:PQQ-binding-like beta-propeller repeat protein [Naumannella sp. ID2617S]|uniref:Pyrrolo-quinoline quinone repeat domain-containing protein n=1 Tax=Enemella dayhoffiae TaxID=2016507 RepID=A0A255GZ21_9ACTN|nr:PQQ-binding-like beta-propeller repeat protein [Enemella dayhoffiae]NNG20261.1 PQQ-binding-like beta-propeller repeat protein [Naumannella sp. ID2617S]OYO20841.1 hypothetical protein CGZ93_11470 [Enemella dayhoffiae]
MRRRPGRGHLIPRNFRVERSPGSAALVLLAIAAVLSLLAALGAASPPGELPSSGAAELVAPDGHHERGTGPGGDVVRETAHLPGTRAFADGPQEYFMAIKDLAEVRSRFWVVETDDAGSGRTPELRSLDESGLHTHLIAGPRPVQESAQGWLVFRPALLELPPDPRAGTEFDSRGTVTSEAGQAAYTDRATLSDGSSFGDGCVRVQHELTIGSAPARETITVRCPGRGVVHVEGRWQQADRQPARGGVEVEAVPGPVDGLRATRIPIQRGGADLAVAPIGVTGVGEDRLWVGNRNTGNVLRLRRQGPAYLSELQVHPGGDLTMVAGCGQAVVAGTAQRRLVAHDAEGHWLWTTELEDVAHPAPGRLGEDLLVATLDGQLHAVSCRDGRVRWSVDEAGSAIQPIVAQTAEGPAVVTAAGKTLRMLTADGESLWEREMPDPVRRVVVGGDLVVVSGAEGRLHAFSTDDGDPRWLTRFTDPADDLHLLGGDVVLVRNGDGIDGVRLATGERLWHHALASEFSVTDGTTGWLAGPAEARTVSADGRLGPPQPVPARPVSTPVLAHGALGPVIVDSTGVTLWRRS